MNANRRELGQADWRFQETWQERAILVGQMQVGLANWLNPAIPGQLRYLGYALLTQATGRTGQTPVSNTRFKRAFKLQLAWFAIDDRRGKLACTAGSIG